MSKATKKTPDRLKVERVAIADLRPDPTNARRHNERNLDAIKASLTRFGQQKPIVIDGAGVVVAGNGTLEAAAALGWKTIAIVRTDLLGEEAAAFALADNRAGELATWDDPALAKALESMSADKLVPGFTREEVDALLTRTRLDADLAHFEGLAGTGNGPESSADPATGNGSRIPSDELSLLITGPRAVIDQLRERINAARHDRPDLTMAAALLELIDGFSNSARAAGDGD